MLILRRNLIGRFDNRTASYFQPENNITKYSSLQEAIDEWKGSYIQIDDLQVVFLNDDGTCSHELYIVNT